MQNEKQQIPGFTLSLHDFAGDLESVFGRLHETFVRLRDDYSNLELVVVDGHLELIGIKRNA